MEGTREALKHSWSKWFARADRVTWGSLSILRLAITRFGEVRGAEAAASLAYYAMFSIFPLMLVLIALGGYVMESSQQMYSQVLVLLYQFIPESVPILQQNLEEVLSQRGAVGVIGLVGLMWSASGVFTALVNHINRAWPRTRERSLLARRFLGLGFVGIVVLGLLFLWFASNTYLDLLPRFGLAGEGGEQTLIASVWWPVVSGSVPFLINLLMFIGLYRWVPNRHVPWIAAFWGAVVASLGWNLAANGFNWYLGSELINLNLIYGSLGTVVAFMLWIYISGLITLFGAHISSAVLWHHDPEGRSDEGS